MERRKIGINLQEGHGHLLGVSPFEPFKGFLWGKAGTEAAQISPGPKSFLISWYETDETQTHARTNMRLRKN